MQIKTIYIDHNDTRIEQFRQFFNVLKEALLSCISNRFFTIVIKGSYEKGKQKLQLEKTLTNVHYLKAEK